MNQLGIVTAARKLHDRVNFRGLPISVENRKGSIRQGVAKNGKPWQTFIRTPYGYLRGTEGVDGDHVDCFVGPNLDAPNVYVVHTRNLETGGYDEDKCMLGYMTPEDAKYEFCRNYDKPDHFGSMTTVPFEQFRANVLGGKYKGQKILAYGTSEGVKKEWDTRGRGVNWQVDPKMREVFRKHDVKIHTVPLNRIHPTEYDSWKDVIKDPKARAGVRGIDDYRQKMKNGDPILPLEAKQAADGDYDIVDGHHRMGALFFQPDTVAKVFVAPKGDAGRKFHDELLDAFAPDIKASSLSVGDEVVVNGIQYRMVVKGFRGKNLVLLESKGEFNRYHPKTILRTLGQVTKL